MRARAYFDAYCFLGTTRSLSRLATIPIDGKTVVQRTLEEWSRLFNWVERASRYDEEQLERKRLLRQEKLDKLHDQLEEICQEQLGKTLQDLEKLRGDKGLGSIATVNLFKLVMDTLMHVLGDGDKQKIEITGKDNGPVEMDITVETFWGRGTDPRRKAPASDEPAKQIDEESEIDAEFGAEIEEEPWEDEEE